MKRMIMRLAAVFTFALVTSLGVAADLPRYKFKVGQELVYSTSSQFDFAKGAFKDSATIKVWVTGENKDGSWHLVYLDKNKNERTGDFASSRETTKFDSLDLFSDGHLVKKSSRLVTRPPLGMFVPLPSDAVQLKSGWEFVENEATQKAYRVKTTPAKLGGEWFLASESKGIFHDIYLMTASETILFDGERGLVERIDSENGQGYGFEGKGKGLTTLDSDTMADKDWIIQLTWEANLLEKAKADADAAFDSLQTGAKTDDAKAVARKALESAAARVKLPILQAEFKSQLDGLDDRFRYAQEDKAKEDGLLNKQAPDWETTDLAGHKHSLAEYRGRVVAMDFWYRGCGWCMRAMPQVKALTSQFHGQPVAILGMNTDQKDTDAQFVIDKLGLNYTTLHAQDIPKMYGVEGYPTFIVIDQKGIVRARHVGYSTKLGEDMAKTINGLLTDTR